LCAQQYLVDTAQYRHLDFDEMSAMVVCRDLGRYVFEVLILKSRSIGSEPSQRRRCRAVFPVA
jgi:hypothetical protein